MRSPHPIAMLVLAVAGLSGAEESAAPPVAQRSDRVALLMTSDPEYARLEVDPRVRLGPDTPSRLVVVRDGQCVRDRGLRFERTTGPTGVRPEVLEASGIIEEAIVAADGRGALLQTLRYSDTVTMPRGGGQPTDEVLSGSVSLTWISPADPDGRWAVDLERGRFVREAVALSLGMGAAVATTDAAGGASDFRLYSSEGRVLMTIAESEASTVTITATPAGGFLAVDLAYPSRDEPATTADRGILVLDLLQGRRWTYTWRYGDEREPLAWRLDDTGLLTVTLPGKVVTFDRTGRQLR